MILATLQWLLSWAAQGVWAFKYAIIKMDLPSLWPNPDCPWTPFWRFSPVPLFGFRSTSQSRVRRRTYLLTLYSKFNSSLFAFANSHFVDTYLMLRSKLLILSHSPVHIVLSLVGYFVGNIDVARVQFLTGKQRAQCIETPPINEVTWKWNEQQL